MTDARWSRRRGFVALAALAVGILTGAVREAVSGVIGGDRWNWTEMAFYVAGWALAMPLLWRCQRWLRSRESFRQHPVQRNRRWREENIAPVLISGVLPEGIDHRAWRRPMRDERHEIAVVRWVWLAVNGVVAGLTAAAAVVANENAWTVWAVAVVVAAQGAAVIPLTAGPLRTARRLLAEMSEGDPARRP